MNWQANAAGASVQVVRPNTDAALCKTPDEAGYAEVLQAEAAPTTGTMGEE